MAAINPYVNFNGNCEEAFNFYKSVFGGDFLYVGRYSETPAEFPVPESEKQKIMHISLPISKETTLMGCDSLEAFGKAPIVGNNISLSIHVQSETEAQDIFGKLAEGGTISMPLEKTFWAVLFGMLTDKFGINWMINYEGQQSSNS